MAAEVASLPSSRIWRTWRESDCCHCLSFWVVGCRGREGGAWWGEGWGCACACLLFRKGRHLSALPQLPSQSLNRTPSKYTPHHQTSTHLKSTPSPSPSWPPHRLQLPHPHHHSAPFHTLTTTLPLPVFTISDPPSPLPLPPRLQVPIRHPRRLPRPQLLDVLPGQGILHPRHVRVR